MKFYYNNSYLMNNKKIAIIIILICLGSLIVGIATPRTKENVENNYEVSGTFTSLKPSRIASIKLEGVITESESSSFFKNPTSSNEVLEQIIKATKDNSIKGIILRINSPGGTVAASQEIYQALLKARLKKPVVITMGDVAASGGYYIASAGDRIFANPGTLTGSIGVITSYYNFTRLFHKIGVEGITIKSGKYKDIGNSSRLITEEEKKILQGLLDNSYNQFISDVAKGRGVDKSKIARIAEGLIYTGEQAKNVGLVDQLGDYNKALNYTQKLVKKRFPNIAKKYGNKDLPIEESWKSGSFFDTLLSASIGQENSFNKILPEKIISQSKFQPLWLLE